MVDFVLGTHPSLGTDAPQNFSFLVGYDKLSPGSFAKRVHHAAAFGVTASSTGEASAVWSNQWAQETSNPGSYNYAHQLDGALVGGPHSDCSGYIDKIDNDTTSEVCTYYNAGFTGAVAYVNKLENALVTSSQKVSNENFYMFPNPANNTLTINLNGGSDLIKVYNSIGQLVITRKINGSVQLDISNLNPGVYTVKSNHNRIIKRFVKN
ncbi:MAG: hypothetical protein ACJA0Q_001833 [Saprospiraceae bacterium]|jgi:hypothetical protein